MEVDGPFLDRLAAAASSGRASLSPEVVLVGSNRLGQDLAWRLKERTGGWANIRFLTLLDLARDLAGGLPSPSDRPLLRGPGKIALAREVLRGAVERDPSHLFAPLAGRRGFPYALSALFDDLLDSEIDALPQPGHGRIDRRRIGAISGLYRDWRERLLRQALHPAELIARGASRAGQFQGRFGTGRLWIAGFYELTKNQMLLLEAIRIAGIELVASMPFPGGREGLFSRPLMNLFSDFGIEVIGPDCGQFPATDLGRFGRSFFEGPTIYEGPAGSEPEAAGGRSPEPDGSLAVVSAPDEEREVRETARRALQLFAEKKIAFHRMAVTFPGGQRAIYGPLLREIFLQAGIPHESHRLFDLRREPEGRALRSLLDLLGEEAPPRARLLDLLSFHSGRLAVSPGRLERLSRRGGIAAWSGDWALRLREAARRRIAEDPEEGAESVTDPDVEVVIPQIEEILQLLSSFPQQGRWSELLGNLERILERILPDLTAHAELRRIASDLSGLDRLEPDTNLEGFRSAWEEELRSAPGERRSTGVVVGDLMELRGLRFDAVFLLGAAEKWFPALPKTDPLLPDTDRSLLNRMGGGPGKLPLKAERLLEEHLIFSGVVASAGAHLQMSYPRMDSSTGRPRLPSIFLLQAVSSLARRRIGVEEVDTVEFVHRAGLTHGDQNLEQSLTPAELALAVAVRAAAGKFSRKGALQTLETLVPSLGRIIRNEELRWDPRFSPADGLISRGILAMLPGARITSAGGSISATRIESYIHCPYQYLQRYVLRLDEPEDPETVFSISAMDRGSLAHRILERTYRALQEAKLLPLTTGILPEAKSILKQIAADEFHRAEREVAVGLPLLWEIAREELLASISGLLLAELESGGHWIPEDFEVNFGQGRGGISVRLDMAAKKPSDPPISISLEGKIDRLDLAARGGAFRIVDYKSGHLPELPFNRGESLQLPIYLLAGREILKARGHPVELEKSEAAFWSLDGKKRDFPGSGWKESYQKLLLAVETAASGIERGIFYQTPGSSRQSCRSCNFRELCDPRVEAIAEQKRDPRAEPLQAMKEELENPRQIRKEETE